MWTQETLIQARTALIVPTALVATNASSVITIQKWLIADHGASTVQLQWLNIVQSPLAQLFLWNLMVSLFRADSFTSLIRLGSGIVVFGTVPISNGTFEPPTTAYFLDAMKPVVTTVPNADHPISNQPLFAASQLSNDEHHILINVTKADSPYTLQHFFVFPRTNFTADMVDNDPGMSAMPSTSTSIVIQSSSIDAQRNVKILAGLLGSVVAIGVIFGAFFVIRRRLRDRRASKSIAILGSGMKSRPGLSLSFLIISIVENGSDTVFTSFTSTESIMRTNPSTLWSSNYSRSDGGSSAVDWRIVAPTPSPPPLPPKRELLADDWVYIWACSSYRSFLITLLLKYFAEVCFVFSS